VAGLAVIGTIAAAAGSPSDRTHAPTGEGEGTDLHVTNMSGLLVRWAGSIVPA
jgi:hypothetical protein